MARGGGMRRLASEATAHWVMPPRVEEEERLEKKLDLSGRPPSQPRALGGRDHRRDWLGGSRDS
ncbi:hypothetical protein E2562_029638, partial [Oryza meyeriana var. granulata]